MIGHGLEDAFHVLTAEAKDAHEFIASEQKRSGIWRLRNIVKTDADLVDPFAIGMLRSERTLHLVIADNAALLQVEQENLARLQTPAAADAAFVDHRGARL